MCFNFRKGPRVKGDDPPPLIPEPIPEPVNPPPAEQESESNIGSGGSSLLDRPVAGHQPFSLRAFRLRELKRATQDFNEDWLLGQGGFGKVYRGILKDPETGKNVLCAVKRLNPDSIQGQQEWLTEIQVLSRISHPNLVQLYGYCTDDGEGLLVYEYLPLGSLDYHLFGPFEDGQKHLTWEERLRIAYQSAISLSFLHEKGVIHRDFKAPNVLLDASRQVKLTDFGLAKLADADKTHVSTRIMGTMGYLDPNYMETGQLTKASDVFSYGVLLLELLTGRPAVEPENPESVNLAVWSHEFFSKKRQNVAEFVDPLILPELDSKASQKLATKLAITAKHCVEDSPQSRPLMKDIVETLKNLIDGYEASKA